MRSVTVGICVLLMMSGMGSIGHAQGVEQGVQTEMLDLSDVVAESDLQAASAEDAFYRGRPGGGGGRPGGGGFRPGAGPRPGNPGGGFRPGAGPRPGNPGGGFRPGAGPRPGRPGGSIGTPSRPAPKPGFPGGIKRPHTPRPGGGIGNHKPHRPGVQKPGKPHRPGFGRPTRPHSGHGKYHKGGWHNRPGWSKAWKWNHHRYPSWWYPAVVLPTWIWVSNVPAGYWQCTAFDEDMNAFSEIGYTRDEAAYNALYECGGDDWDYAGCYVPEQYCRLRY